MPNYSAFLFCQDAWLLLNGRHWGKLFDSIMMLLLHLVLKKAFFSFSLPAGKW